MALWTPRLIKPTSHVRANLAHPQARELAFFLHNVGGGTFVDAVTGKTEGAASGQSALASSEGNVLHLGGTTRSSGTAFVNTQATVQNFCTVIANLRLTTKPASRCTAVQYGVSSNGSGPFVGFDSNGFAHGGCSGTNGTNSSASLDAVDHTGKWVVVAGSWFPTGAKTNNAVSNGSCVWVDGVAKFFGTAGAGSQSTNAVPNTLALGREISNYNNFFVGDIAWGVGLNRLLSDDEQAWWAQHAYEVLEQNVSRSFFSMPAAAGGNVYNDSVSESGSASDSPTDVATLPSSASESGSASDAPSSVATLPSSVSESGTASDAASSLATLPSTAAESGAASDAPSNIGTFGVSASESGSAADTPSTGTTFASTISETGTASDAPSSVAVLPSSVSDSLAAFDAGAILAGSDPFAGTVIPGARFPQRQERLVDSNGRITEPWYRWAKFVDAAVRALHVGKADINTPIILTSATAADVPTPPSDVWYIFVDNVTGKIVFKAYTGTTRELDP